MGGGGEGGGGGEFREASDRPRWLQEGLREPKMASKIAQDSPTCLKIAHNMPPRGSKTTLRRLQVAKEPPKEAPEKPKSFKHRRKSMFLAFSPFRFRGASEASRWLQDDPRDPQEGPKRVPRGAQERPRAPQERPKSDPGALNRAPRAPKNDPRGPQERSKSGSCAMFVVLIAHAKVLHSQFETTKL